MNPFIDQVQERIDRLERMEPAFEAMRAALRTISEQTCDHGPQESCPREIARVALWISDKVKE